MQAHSPVFKRKLSCQSLTNAVISIIGSLLLIKICLEQMNVDVPQVVLLSFCHLRAAISCPLIKCNFSCLQLGCSEPNWYTETENRHKLSLLNSQTDLKFISVNLWERKLISYDKISYQGISAQMRIQKEQLKGYWEKLDVFNQLGLKDLPWSM